MNDATNNSISCDSFDRESSSETLADGLKTQEELQSNSDTQSKNPISAQESAQNIDWQKLAHKLREHNRKLLKKVFNLEQNIIDATNQVKESQEIARQEELTITEQAEKLNHSQEEIADLSKQLEKERQEIKSQEVLIKNLSLQLQISQEQIAKLERECAVVQENCNQKTYEISSLTEQKEELESRLYRQQQQTLEYKTALEKYSEKEKTLEKLPSIKILSRLKHQPIKPWSDDAKDFAINNVLPTMTNSEMEYDVLETSSEIESSEKSHNWPAPEIRDIPTEKQPKSIAAVKLPKFHKANQ